jgi:hypothetical protein
MQRGHFTCNRKVKAEHRVVRKQPLFEGPSKVPFQQKELFVLGQNPLSMFQRMDE